MEPTGPPGSYQPSAVSYQPESVLDEFYLGQKRALAIRSVVPTTVPGLTAES